MKEDDFEAWLGSYAALGTIKGRLAPVWKDHVQAKSEIKGKKSGLSTDSRCQKETPKLMTRFVEYMEHLITVEPVTTWTSPQ